MAEILDIIDPQGDLKEALESCRSNFWTLNKQGLRAGSYLLDFRTVLTAQSLTSATYINLTEFQGSFSSSGGLVIISGAIYASIATGGGGTGTLALYVDDREVAWIQINSTATETGSTLPLLWASDMNAGNHKWSLKAKASGATLTVGFLSSTGAGSTFSIIEQLRG